MKKNALIIIGALALVGTSAVAFAQADVQGISGGKEVGAMPAALLASRIIRTSAMEENCQIYSDHVVITKSVSGGEENTSTHPTHYTGAVTNGAVALDLVKAAANGLLRTQEGPTDGPYVKAYSSFYQGTKKTDVLIYESISGRITVNTEAEALGGFVDRNCI